MSRWISNFKSHPFQEKIRNLISVLHNFKITTDTKAADVLEVARLRKAVKYIEESLSIIDSELVPPSYFDKLTNDLDNILVYFSQYSSSSNRSIASLHAANSHVDNILNVIAPICGKGSSAAKSARYAFEKYAATVDEHLAEFHSKASKVCSELKGYADSVQEISKEIDSSKTQIENFRDELFVDTSERDSVKKNISDMEAKANSAFTEIQNYYKELFEDDSRGDAISSQIEEALNASLRHVDKMQGILDESTGSLDEIKLFHEMVFGKSSADDKSLFVGGLKDELLKRKRDLDQFKSEQEIRYKALNDEIETLLPGATSAGLTTAYRDMKNSFDSIIKNSTWIFYGSIVALFIVSVVSVTNKIYWFGIDWVDLKDVSNLWSNFAYKIPLALPIIWLAFFASKRRSEAQRLQQEYAHKEALAKSYQSYKVQVEQLGQNAGELMQHLLKSAIDAITFNASNTLESKHGDKSPLQDVIDKLLENKEALEMVIKQDAK